MAKSLNGSELASFMKVRQLRQVRNLRQEYGVTPRLLILMSNEANEASEVYVRMKQRYAEDIEAEVEVISCDENDMQSKIEAANEDRLTQGVIVQLPLKDAAISEQIVKLIAPEKDVDGLGENGDFISATAHAIDWLLAGYDINLEGEEITLLGQGKLVGAPLAKMWQARELNVNVLDEYSTNTHEILQKSDIIISATGVPGVLKSDDVKYGAVVVDAGTTSENGVIKGDVHPDLRLRDDVTITPEKGGVGPMTIAVLFDHLIEACLKSVGKLG